MAGNLSYFAAGVLVPLVIAGLWMIPARLIGPLKRDRKLSYCVAVFLAWIVALENFTVADLPAWGEIAGALMVTWLVLRVYSMHLAARSAQQ
jgi:hypothetical protein